MWRDDFRESVFENAPHDVVQELSVFNAVFNNWDRHPGNYLATRRDGVFHFASIDNESIENKGILLKWGERSHIPILFTEDPRAQINEQICLGKDVTLSDFERMLASYGFERSPRIIMIFNNLCNRGEADRNLYVSEGTLMIPFHQGSHVAFPLPKAPYSPTLVQTYRQLNQKKLARYFPLLSSSIPDFTLAFQKFCSDVICSF